MRAVLPQAVQRRSRWENARPRASAAPLATLRPRTYRRSSQIVRTFDYRTRRRGAGPRATTMKGRTDMAKAKAQPVDDREAFARKPETIGKIATKAPQTGEEYLASLRDGRSVYI